MKNGKFTAIAVKLKTPGCGWIGFIWQGQGSRMRSRLGWYCELWGERLLGDVEDNVLAIIKTRAEG